MKEEPKDSIVGQRERTEGDWLGREKVRRGS